jgi:hypothetical protein
LLLYKANNPIEYLGKRNTSLICMCLRLLHMPLKRTVSEDIFYVSILKLLVLGRC